MKNQKNKFGNHFHNFLLTNWLRYLDDCFILWTYTQDQLTEFHQLINSINCNIQFTIDYNSEKLPFLDILIINKTTHLETDIYAKPTDSKQYLLFSSCHPKHTKTNIHFNLARSICTIVSNPQTKIKRLNELKNILIERQYPTTLIQNAITRAQSIDTSELRTTRRNQDQPKHISFISTHNPRNTEAFNIINQNIPYLKRDPRLRDILNKHTLIKCKRQPKSLKGLLTSAKIPNRNNNYSVTKCHRPNCGICNFLIESPTYNFKSGKTFHIKHNFSCTSSNLIYLIRCNGCLEEYIGQTSLTLRKRFTVHRQQIRDPNTRQIPVSSHLADCPANTHPKYNIFPLYQCLTNTEQFRINKEAQLISLFKPKLNSI
ncbi:uncharacterized protein LOC115230173 [Argonauta hians]